MSWLRDAVDERFALTGRDTPGWPAPRAPMARPAEEEYSRLLDPGKYRILPARLRAWSDVLLELGLMREDELDPATLPPALPEHPSERVVRWTPVAADALALVFGFRSLEAVADAVVDIGVGGRPLWVDRTPVCGCDACDDGSAALLGELDDAVELVVARGFVHASWGDAAVWTTWAGQLGQGGVDLSQLDDLGRLPEDAVVLRGVPWTTRPADRDLGHAATTG